MTRLFLAMILAALVLSSIEAGAQDSWGPSLLIGAPSNSMKNLECAQGKYMIGIQVRSGWYIHRLQLECATLDANGQASGITLTPAYIGGNVGGTAYQSRCGSGKVVVGFRGRSGQWIDRIQLACKSWKSGAGASGTVAWLTALGGTGGELYGPITCPGVMAVNRFDGYSGVNGLTNQDLVNGYRMYCKSP